MAVVQLSGYVYIGISTDTKPSTHVISGSQFIEYDTGALFRWDGTAWRLTPQTRIHWEHQKIHQGVMYQVDYNSAYQGLAATDTIDIYVQVPADTYPHILSIARASSLCQFFLYEGTTVTDAGTALTVDNRNRNSSNTSVLTVTHTPTVDSIGTVLHDGHWIGSGGPLGGGGEFNWDLEMILKPSTDYLFRILAYVANTSAGLELNWYE